jgi:hypothetical protein
MNGTATPALLGRLAALRVELVDLAFDLDVRGSCAAADVAMTTSARLAEICEEFSAPPGHTDPKPIPSCCPKRNPSFVESSKHTPRVATHRPATNPLSPNPPKDNPPPCPPIRSASIA